MESFLKRLGWAGMLGLVSEATLGSESSKKVRRWNGYVCPACRLVFRVPSDHDGKGVVCPSCRRLLRIPGEGDNVPPLVCHGGEGPKEAEPEAGTPHPHRVRRHRRSGDATPDWESVRGGRSGPGGGMWLWSIISGIAVLVVIGVAVRYFFEGSDGARGVPGGGDEMMAALVTDEIGLGPAGGDENPLVDDDATRESAGSPAEVLVDAEPVARRFVAARSVEDLLPWVLNPAENEPKIREWYREHGFGDLEIKEFGVNRTVIFRNGLASVTVKTSDFDIRQIVVGKTADGFKVDWASWVGWSEMSWKKLREMRPVEPQLFRVSAELGKYYNFGFSDDTQWRCYQLGMPDGIDFIFGYVRRGSELDMKMAGVTDKPVALTLRIHFPENAPSDNQVFIDSLVAQGWVVGAGGEAEQ